jgi:hypothetical protein
MAAVYLHELGRQFLTRTGRVFLQSNAATWPSERGSAAPIEYPTWWDLDELDVSHYFFEPVLFLCPAHEPRIGGEGHRLGVNRGVDDEAGEVRRLGGLAADRP